MVDNCSLRFGVWDFWFESYMDWGFVVEGWRSGVEN